MSHESFNPGYPVHIYHEGMELPEEGIYFLVAGNGIWLHKDMPTFRGFVPVDNISVLQDLNAKDFIVCKLPKIPTRCVWRIKEFFRQVVDKHRAEACTVLYFNENNNDWRVHIPIQQVSHGGVQYRRVGITHLEGMEDYTPVGTIHSHCDFGAFHSGTDHSDEESFDGLHITFGHNDKDEFTISASYVLNGERFKLDPMDCLEGIEPVGQDRYRIVALEDGVKEEWTEGIDRWMLQVRGSYNFWNRNFWGQDSKVIRKGDKVVWTSEMKQAQLKAVMGDGPFEVVSNEGDKLSVITPVGLAKMSSKLFKKEGS